MGLAKHQNGLRDRVVAATLWQSPTVLKTATKNIAACLGGLVNSSLGNRHKKVLLRNMQYLRPNFLQNYDVDLEKLCANMEGITDIDKKISWKVCKEKSLDDYHQNYSCSKYFQDFKVPTLVYYAEDDPIIDKTCIGFETAKDNENILIASNKYGSHLCSFNHFLTYKQWLPKPAFEFFDYFLENNLHLPSPQLKMAYSKKSMIPKFIDEGSEMEAQS